MGWLKWDGMGWDGDRREDEREVFDYELNPSRWHILFLSIPITIRTNVGGGMDE